MRYTVQYDTTTRLWIIYDGPMRTMGALLTEQDAQACCDELNSEGAALAVPNRVARDRTKHTGESNE
jgi:hypothetical protein